MRQIKAISLIALISLPGVMCLSFLHWQKAHVRHEVKEMLIRGFDRDSLTSLTFSAAEAETLLEWEHEHEFEYAGEMYDVVETEKSGDSVTYYCWLDRDETHLNKILSSLTANSIDKDPINNSSRNRVTDVLKFQYVTPTHFVGKINAIEKRHPHLKTELPISRLLLPPPVPPPVSI